MREPGPQPIETLHVVHHKGARAAGTREANKSNSPAAIANHRVQNPAGIKRRLYFPVIATFQVIAALPVQSPTDGHGAEPGTHREHRADGSSMNCHKRSRKIAAARRVFGVAGGHRGIGRNKSQA